MNIIKVNDYIVSDPSICHGKFTFTGTRIMVWQVLDKLAHGATTKQIIDDYPALNKQHILSALSFAAEKIQHEYSLTLNS